MEKLIFFVTMNRSKSFLINKYSKEWFKSFKLKSKGYLKEVLVKTPDIGKSVFSFNYKFAPAYIAWYKAFVNLGISQEEIDINIWAMNEKMLDIMPKSWMHKVGKTYFSSFRRKAAEHIQRQNTVGIHPYDFLIDYRNINENCFEIDIKRCGIQKLAKDFDAAGLLPGICRMDYLFADLMKNGFERTKTLGDGDECCNCRYYLEGDCEWAPEKGFIDRK